MRALGLACVLGALLLDAALGNDVGELLKQGDAAFAASTYTSAVRYYSQAIDLQSTQPLLYTKRAAAYISLRSLAQALRDLNKAVELDDAFVQGYINRGKLQRQMCNYAAAERDFKRVLELKPGQKVAEQELQRTLAARSKMEAVQAAVQTAEAAKAEAAKAAGDDEDPPNTAAADLERIKPTLESLYEDSPDCVQAQVLEAQLMFAAAEYEQVVAVTGRIVKADDRQLDALVLRGRAYFYLYDHDMAKRHFGEALKYDPDHSAARKEFNKVKDYDRKRSRAEKALEAQDWEAAEMAYIESLHVDREHRKGNEALWFGLCRARAALGRIDLAVTACSNVLILAPGHREAKLRLVRTLLDAERFDEAQVKAREFLSQHQNDGEFHELAREAERRLKMAKRKDYYKVLGVDKSAGDREIKRAYRELAKKYHPDKVSAEEREASEAQFREIAEAYEVLSDEGKRQAYDSGQDLEEMQHGGGGGGHPFFQQGGMHFTFRFG
ncbi:hypothetical protein HYH02_005712 [Chlamydomonas schloesseri]|uniref:J domain-containing protein n=1 Tax=Chlamydomonas schloesseri TaxID=2026947 RepID=A0A836B6L5_9CHLO|nr:hypothetical protein HYH02_005712 [Chlamydomonas schloesseri]|eukprot:KAG2448958.1 hypothetical protein HYH02_005712 [Chlamydomonas schloesseri]